MKGGEAQENDEECLDVEKRTEYRDNWQGEFFPVSHAASLSNDRSISPCGMWRFLTTLLVWLFIPRSSWSSDSSGCSEWKRTLSTSNVQDDIPYWGKNFQTESILGAIEDDILLDNRTRWMHAGTYEIMTTWLEGGPTPCRVLAWNQWYTSATRKNGRHLQNYHDMDRW
jgi:hypothetical protein